VESGEWKTESCRGIVLSIILLSTLLCPLSTRCQNMPHEAGLYVAFGGHLPLVTTNDANRGFYTNPTIEHGYYSFVTNGVQSLSVFAEHVSETRSWHGIWSVPTSAGVPPSFPADVDESLQMTTVGLETIRTLISESDFRFGAGLGVAYGLGGATADVRDSASHQLTHYSSQTAWNALLLEFMLRAKYTIAMVNHKEIAIVAEGRYWGFPAIGPIGEAGSAYNGPALRALSELGYLAGVSVGF
jgi:hypothetical protein